MPSGDDHYEYGKMIERIYIFALGDFLHVLHVLPQQNSKQPDESVAQSTKLQRRSQT